MVSFGLYAAVSVLALAATVGYAQQTRLQFYPTVIFLVSSKFCVMVLGNMAFVLTVFLAKITKSIFLGRLRPGEFFDVLDKARYAIVETCLTLIIFREEINAKTVALFTALFFCKIFHWLAAARLEHIEQSQVTSIMKHVRIVSLLLCLLLADSVFLHSAVQNSFDKNGTFVPSVLIYFSFEATILATTVTSISCKYCLNLADMFANGQWHNKSTFKFYLELIINAVRSILYVVFFMIIFVYYGLPMHLIRDLWVSIKNLIREWKQFRRYRKLCANMDVRFPNATAEQLENNSTCIICRDEMVGDPRAKVLPCGHVFHFYCLRSWLERQQTCPVCRTPIPDDVTSSRTTARRNEQAEAADARRRRLQPVVNGNNDDDDDDAHPIPGAARVAPRYNPDERNRIARRALPVNADSVSPSTKSPEPRSDVERRNISRAVAAPDIVAESTPARSLLESPLLLPPLPLAPPLHTPTTPSSGAFVSTPPYTPVERELASMRVQMDSMQKQIAELLELSRRQMRGGTAPSPSVGAKETSTRQVDAGAEISIDEPVRGAVPNDDDDGGGGGENADDLSEASRLRRRRLRFFDRSRTGA